MTPRCCCGIIPLVDSIAYPKGITVDEAARLLHISGTHVRRLIARRVIVAWKPCGEGSRKYLVDEVSLARFQQAQILRARAEAAATQKALIQGMLF